MDRGKTFEVGREMWSEEGNMKGERNMEQGRKFEVRREI